MTLPGFTAEASLGATREQGGRRGPHRSGRGGLAVRPQLKGGGFHRPRLGGLNTIGDYYTCKSGCYSAWWACLDTCEGTLDNPQPSGNCTLCDDDYNACMRGCTRDIA